MNFSTSPRSSTHPAGAAATTQRRRAGYRLAAAVFLFAGLLVANLPAANVRLAFTNNFTGLPDTNSFLLVAVNDPILANGSVITIGLPHRYTPTANGSITNSLAKGFYQATNAFLGRGIIFAVPDDSSATVYDAFTPIWSGGLAASGFNTYNVGIITAAILDRFATNYFMGSLNSASNFLYAYATTNSSASLSAAQVAAQISSSNLVANATLLTASNGLRSFTLTIGANDTNYANLIGGNDTNFARNVIGLAATNYANLIGGNDTNFARNIIGTAATNFALAIGANDTNYANLIGANATNFARNVIGLAATNYANGVVGLAGSNNVVAVSNALYSIMLSQFGSTNTATMAAIIANGNTVSNGSVSFARSSVGGNLTNLVYQIAANQTNFTKATTNNFPLSSLAVMPLTNNETRNVIFSGNVENDGTAYFGPGSTSKIEPSGAFVLGNGRISGDVEGALSANNVYAETFTANVGFFGNATSSSLASSVAGSVTNSWRKDISDTNALILPAVTSLLSSKASKTNAQFYEQLMLGSLTNIVLSTNSFALYRSQAAGGYFGSGGIWTNRFDTRYKIIALAGNYYVQSNGVTLYASGDSQTWTPIPPGIAPAPISGFGGFMDFTGFDIRGLLASTNLTAQILALATNSSGGLDTNAVIALIAQYGVNPTNGITATNLYAILASSNYVVNATLLTASNYLYTVATATNVTSAFVTNAVNGLVPALVQNSTVGGVAVGTVSNFTFNTTGSNYIFAVAQAATNPIPGWINAAGLAQSNNALNISNLQSVVLIAATNGSALYSRTVAGASTNMTMNVSNSLFATIVAATNGLTSGGGGGSATNAVGNNKGFGTNVSLYATTSLNSSNLLAYSTGGLQPIVVSGVTDNRFNGVYYKSATTHAGFNPPLWFKSDDTTNNISYNTVYWQIGTITSPGGGTASIQISNPPAAWTEGTYSAFIAGTSTYTNGTIVFSNDVVNVFDSGSGKIELLSTNGILAIGNVDSTVGFTVNGQSIQNTIYNSVQTITNIGLSGIVTTNLVVSGASYEPALNGIYQVAKTNIAGSVFGYDTGQPAVYTNSVNTNSAIVLYGYNTNLNSVVRWFLTTNFSGAFNSFGMGTLANSNCYYNLSLFGTYPYSAPAGLTPYPVVQYQVDTNSAYNAAFSAAQAATNGLPQLVASNGIQLTLAGNTLFVKASGNGSALTNVQPGYATNFANASFPVSTNLYTVNNSLYPYLNGNYLPIYTNGNWRIWRCNGTNFLSVNDPNWLTALAETTYTNVWTIGVSNDVSLASVLETDSFAPTQTGVWLDRGNDGAAVIGRVLSYTLQTTNTPVMINYGTQFANGPASTNVIYVDSTILGNDLNDGTRLNPLSTLYETFSRLTNGGTIYLGEGSFFYNTTQWPTNINVVGKGQGVTFIYNDYPAQQVTVNPFPITLGENSTVNNLTFVRNIQFPVSSGNLTLNNVTIDSLTYHDVDGLGQGNIISGNVIVNNCTINSRYDCVAFQLNGNTSMLLNNCIFHPQNPSGSTFDIPQAFNMQLYENASFIVNGGILILESTRTNNAAAWTITTNGANTHCSIDGLTIDSSRVTPTNQFEPTLTSGVNGGFLVANKYKALNGFIALGGSTYSGNGSGLTNLNAANITSGTLPNSQLPSNVVTNNGFQTIAANLWVNGVLTVTNAGVITEVQSNYVKTSGIKSAATLSFYPNGNAGAKFEMNDTTGFRTPNDNNTLDLGAIGTQWRTNYSATVRATNIINLGWVQYTSNVWTIATATNGMGKGDWRDGNSNGVPVLYGFDAAGTFTFKTR